jgi:hypothetical protein
MLEELVATPGMERDKNLLAIPYELHGHIYSYLEWGEKMKFISISREISSHSRNYRQLKLNNNFSDKYAHNASFRANVLALVNVNNLDVNLSGNWMLPDACLIQLADVCALNLSGCGGITDAGLVHLGCVRNLDLSRSCNFTDAGLVHLGRVQRLNLSSCFQVTDCGLAHLGSVQTLLLRANPQITDQGLRYLVGVHHLDISGCHRITEEGVKVFKNIGKEGGRQCREVIHQ